MKEEYGLSKITISLIEKAKSDDEKAKEELYRNMMPIIKRIIKGKKNNKDLYQQGCLYLFEALRKYNIYKFTKDSFIEIKELICELRDSSQDKNPLFFSIKEKLSPPFKRKIDKYSDDEDLIDSLVTEFNILLTIPLEEKGKFISIVLSQEMEDIRTQKDIKEAKREKLNRLLLEAIFKDKIAKSGNFVQFKSYATKCIVEKMKDYLSENKLIQMPKEILYDIKELKKAEESLIQELQRNPPNHELEKKLGWNLGKIEKIKSLKLRNKHMTQYLNLDDEKNIPIKDPNIDCKIKLEEAEEIKKEREEVKNAIDILKKNNPKYGKRIEQIIELRKEGKDNKKIADELEISSRTIERDFKKFKEFIAKKKKRRKNMKKELQHLSQDSLTRYYDYYYNQIHMYLPDRQEVEKHLDICSICKNELQELREILLDAETIPVTEKDIILVKRFLEREASKVSSTEKPILPEKQGILDWVPAFKKKFNECLKEVKLNFGRIPQASPSFSCQGEDKDNASYGKSGPIAWSIEKDKGEIVVRFSSSDKKYDKDLIDLRLRFTLVAGENIRKEFIFENSGGGQAYGKITLDEKEEKKARSISEWYIE